TLDRSIEANVHTLLSSLPQTEFTGDLEKLLADSYQSGSGFGDAFAKLMTAILGERGLILLDPLDSDLKKLAAPLYAEAARRSHDIAVAIVNRSQELEAAGYHAQVSPSENSFPLFLHDEGGARRALARTANGKYQTKTDGVEYSASELAEW